MPMDVRSRRSPVFPARWPAIARRLAAALLAALLAAACASKPPPPKTLRVGSRVQKVTLFDQNDQPHQIDETVRVIFFAREMEGGKVIRALLDTEGPAFLKKYRAVYVADISDMPSVIANMIAIPKMRDERPYPTLLDRDGSASAAYPSEEGRVTILLLDRLKVTGIEYRGSVGGLREAVARRR